jgi:hypothetical protein
VTSKNNSQDGKHKLLTLQEVADELRVKIGWVRDHTSGRRKPYLPCVALGDQRKKKRVRDDQLDKFIEDYTRNDTK